MQLKKIGLTRLTTPKFIQLNTEMKDLLTANTTVYTKTKKYFDATFLPSYTDMLDAFKKAEKSDYSDSINDANALRGGTYVGLYEMVRALLRHPDKKISAAASKVKNLLDRYGNFTSTSLDGQTAYINDLLREFETNYTTEVTLLNLTQFITTLKENNVAFTTLMNERYEETLKLSKITVADGRKSLQIAFTTMCNLIDSIWVMEEDAAVTAFINRFNVVLARFGVGTGGGDSETSSETPTTPPEDEEEGDTPIDNPDEKYPNAREWNDTVIVANTEDGDIFYIIRDGKKVYYRILNKMYVSTGPETTKYPQYWELLS